MYKYDRDYQEILLILREFTPCFCDQLLADHTWVKVGKNSKIRLIELDTFKDVLVVKLDTAKSVPVDYLYCNFMTDVFTSLSTTANNKKEKATYNYHALKADFMLLAEVIMTELTEIWNIKKMEHMAYLKKLEEATQGKGEIDYEGQI